MTSRNRSQSFSVRYFLHKLSLFHVNASCSTHLASSSSTSPNGVRSKMIKPGQPIDSGYRHFGEIGMENMSLVNHFPDSGTSSLCCTQMAVPSLTVFVESQICQW